MRKQWTPTGSPPISQKSSSSTDGNTSLVLPEATYGSHFTTSLTQPHGHCGAGLGRRPDPWGSSANDNSRLIVLWLTL
jgi:hypothetical protein